MGAGTGRWRGGWYNTEKLRGIPLFLRLICVASLLSGSLFAAGELERAQKLYNRTNFQGAVELLSPIAAHDAAAAELLGQCYFFLGDYPKATAAFERSIAQDPARSSAYHWLGRTYGRRAETSFALSAMSYAGKARSNFENAIELDPENSEAVNDLFEYYLQAPGFLGGGFEKAAKIADKIAERDPAEGAFARARLAEERKDWSTAEAMLRRAIELAPRQPGRLIDLAKLLAKEGRYEESDSTFQEARRFAPEAPKVLFAEASTYIRAKRKPAEARELLRQYLSMNLSPEDPSRSEARKLLKQIAVSGTT